MSKRLFQESKRMESSAQVPELMWRAFPPHRSANRKSWLATVARALGWRHRRVKALFYCEARVVTADEWRTLNERLDRLKAAERRHQEEMDELQENLRVARETAARTGRIAGELRGLAQAAGRSGHRPEHEAADDAVTGTRSTTR